MFVWCHKKLTWLPLLPLAVLVAMLLGTMITYSVAAALGHVSVIFPFISDTGTGIPESSLFSLFLVLTGVLTFFTAYFRYRVIRYITRCRVTAVNRLSAFCMFLAVLFSLGLAIVGCFQEDKLPLEHMIGANMIFGCGVLYTILDATLTCVMCRIHTNEPRWLCCLRLCIGFCTLVFFIATTVCDTVSKHIWSESTHQPGDDKRHWRPDEAGYSVHLGAAFSEWLMAFSFLCYFLTFIVEFRHFRFLCVLRRTNDVELLLDDIPDFASASDDDSRLLR